jgi:hypothetical protein
MKDHTPWHKAAVIGSVTGFSSVNGLGGWHASNICHKRRPSGGSREKNPTNRWGSGVQMLELSHEKISSLRPAAYNPRRISKKSRVFDGFFP